MKPYILLSIRARGRKVGRTHGLLVTSLTEFSPVFDIPPTRAAALFSTAFMTRKFVVFYVGRHERMIFRGQLETWFYGVRLLGLPARVEQISETVYMDIKRLTARTPKKSHLFPSINHMLL